MAVTVVAAALSLLACGPAAPLPVTAVVDPAAPPGTDPLTPEERLLGLLTADNAPRLEQVATSIARLGDEVMRQDAGVRLLALARDVSAPSWSAPPADEEDDPSGADVAIEQRRTQALRPILAAMSHLGGRAVVAYAFAVAEDEAAPLDRRRLALRVLERTVRPGDVPANERLARVLAALPRPTQARVTDVARLLQTHVKMCYRGWDPAPAPAGKLVVTLRIGRDGVASISVEGSLPSGIQDCVAGVARRLGPVEGLTPGTVMSVPFAVILQ